MMQRSVRSSAVPSGHAAGARSLSLSLPLYVTLSNPLLAGVPSATDG